MARKRDEPRTNKLSVYLLKETVTDFAEAVDTTDPRLGHFTIPGVGRLYYSTSKVHKPDWLLTFFNNDSAIDDKHFKSATARAVLIVKVQYRSKDFFFALPFGSGRYLLKEDIYEERFGLKTTINLIESSLVRSIGKKTLSTNPMLRLEQISREANVTDFGINIETDLIQSITGKSNESGFGRMLTGKDSFSLSANVDKTNIHDFLQKCLRSYHSNKYLQKFEWIDFIKYISDAALIADLETQLLEDILNAKNNVWLAVPDIIEWSDVEGFKYSHNTDDLYFDLLLEDLLGIYAGEDFNIDVLRKSSISALSRKDERLLHKWPAYKCLNAELVTKDDRCYLLDNGKWYEIKKSFALEVRDFINGIAQSKIKFPEYDTAKHTEEGDYNKELATLLGAHCLDKQNLSYGGGHSKIETCDIITKKNELLFVKRYTSSSSMSHLFAQGYVSGELLLSDPEFRTEVINILPKSFKSILPPKNQPFDPNKYTLTYVIITKKEGQQLPFFSKVNLRSFVKNLRLFGYTVEVAYV